MTELDLEFQTVCHRTRQAEQRLERQQALVALCAAKGQPTGNLEDTLSMTASVLASLRAQRSDMARTLRYRARKSRR